MKEAHLMEQDTYKKIILKCKFKRVHGIAWRGGMMWPTQVAEYKGSKTNNEGKKKTFYIQY
jgi:hypothetical protein